MALRFDELDEPIEVVSALVGHVATRQHRFQRLSTACWAWKPTTRSTARAFAASSRTTAASSSALSISVAPGSRLGKDSPLPERLFQQRSPHTPPVLDVVLADHDQVDRYAEASKHAYEPHELRPPAGNLTLDHEQVEVALRAGLAARVRAEGSLGPGGRTAADKSSPARWMSSSLTTPGR